eukprot:795454-Rhodomonas_salina.1
MIPPPSSFTASCSASFASSEYARCTPLGTVTACSRLEPSSPAPFQHPQPVSSPSSTARSPILPPTPPSSQQPRTSSCPLPAPSQPAQPASPQPAPAREGAETCFARRTAELGRGAVPAPAPPQHHPLLSAQSPPSSASPHAPPLFF